VGHRGGERNLIVKREGKGPNKKEGKGKFAKGFGRFKEGEGEPREKGFFFLEGRTWKQVVKEF